MGNAETLLCKGIVGTELGFLFRFECKLLEVFMELSAAQS